MATPYRYVTKAKMSNGDATVPTQRLIWDPTTGKHREWEKTNSFIKGPIPLDWVKRANALPGKAGAVGIALWFLAGVKRSLTFKVTAEAERVAACTRQAFSQGLYALEGAGLIAVNRQTGTRPEVDIRTASSSPTRN
jgi:hypothetical protein